MTLVISGSTIVNSDCLTHLRTMSSESVQMCVTSPPYYGLRDYGVDGQIGLENTPDAYVTNLVEVFREVRRVLKNDGTLWLNLGDSYGKGKQLLGIPWRVALALQADGWVLRQDIIWHKPNPMPESVTDRCTKGHEYVFLFSKRPRYYFDHVVIKEPAVGGAKTRKRSTNFGKVGKVGNHLQGSETIVCDGTRNRRSVWSVNSRQYTGAHFATYPPALIEPCIKAGSRIGDVVLDPFFGAGTTGVVCAELNRVSYGIELNPDYATLAGERIKEALRCY